MAVASHLWFDGSSRLEGAAAPFPAAAGVHEIVAVAVPLDYRQQPDPQGLFGANNSNRILAIDPDGFMEMWLRGAGGTINLAQSTVEVPQGTVWWKGTWDTNTGDVVFYVSSQPPTMRRSRVNWQVLDTTNQPVLTGPTLQATTTAIVGAAEDTVGAWPLTGRQWGAWYRFDDADVFGLDVREEADGLETGLPYVQPDGTSWDLAAGTFSLVNPPLPGACGCGGSPCTCLVVGGGDVVVAGGGSTGNPYEVEVPAARRSNRLIDPDGIVQAFASTAVTDVETVIATATVNAPGGRYLVLCDWTAYCENVSTSVLNWTVRFRVNGVDQPQEEAQVSGVGVDVSSFNRETIHQAMWLVEIGTTGPSFDVEVLAVHDVPAGTLTATSQILIVETRTT